MNNGRIWSLRCNRPLATLVAAVLCTQFALGQPVLAEDASKSTLDTLVFKGLDNLLEYLQGRSRDLVITRGMTPSSGAISAERLKEQLLDGECLYIIGEETPAEAYSVWVLSRTGVARHHEPTALQTVTTGLTAWQRKQVPLYSVKARAPVPRGAQRTDPPSIVASSVAPPPTNNQVANWLFPPALRPALNHCEHLTLQVPGAMAILPWAALPYSDQALLIDRFSLSLLPDLQALAGNRSATPGTGPRQERIAEVDYRLESALIVGNPRYNDPEWLLPDLPGAQREAESVDKEMPQTRLLLGEQVTKTHALTELGRQRWDMVYLATHAVADTRQPLERSFVALTPTFAGAGDASGRWTAREVQGLKLKADITVLSACQTGLGGEHDAGVIGIGRAFFMAGVPHVITSLWSVDDDATANLMTRFVKQIKRNNRPKYFPADALQLAMLHAKEGGKPVGQWASFAHFGVVNVFTK
jgi:CHAT domain-containing protein